jgi:hypothetical protein
MTSYMAPNIPRAWRCCRGVRARARRRRQCGRRFKTGAVRCCVNVIRTEFHVNTFAWNRSIVLYNTPDAAWGVHTPHICRLWTARVDPSEKLDSANQIAAQEPMPSISDEYRQLRRQRRYAALGSAISQWNCLIRFKL